MIKKSLLLDNNKEKIIEFYNDGLKIKEIAEYFNVGVKLVRIKLRKWNKFVSNYTAHNLEKYKKEILYLYNQGESASKIGNKFNANHSSIINKLKKWGIEIKSSSFYLTGNKSPSWKGYEEISLSLFHHFQYCAKIRNILFDISIEEIWQIYLEQNRKCVFTGEKLIFGPKNKNISLDRINSSEHYFKDNCQLVLIDINLAKQSLSDRKFIELCKKVVKYNNFKNKAKLSSNCLVLPI